jgi:hypothetical protein
MKFDVLKNNEVLSNFQRAGFERSAQLRTRNWQAATDDAEGSNSMLQMENRMMMGVNQSIVGDRTSPFSNAFTLLDVSTNADLMGVSLGFANDDFIFRRTHAVKKKSRAIQLA